MSNYHYNDQTTCKSCNKMYDYTDLKNLTDYQCDQPCICRFTSERSTKDRMDYDVFVLGQNITLPLMKPNPLKFNSGNNSTWAAHTFQENETL